MKPASVTKLDKKNTETWKKFEDDVMSANCDVIDFPLFMANLQPSGSGIPKHGLQNLRFH